MKKIHAFTIIETIVALLIIVTIFGIVTVAFSKVMDSSNLNEKFEVHILLNDYAIQTKSRREFIAAKADYTRFAIERQFDFYKGNKSLLLMTITAKNVQGKLIDSYHEIILLGDEKN